jgi:hypothetical protein
MPNSYYEVTEVDPGSGIFGIREINQDAQIPESSAAFKKRLEAVLKQFSAIEPPRDETVLEALHAVAQDFAAGDEIKTLAARLDQIEILEPNPETKPEPDAGKVVEPPFPVGAFKVGISDENPRDIKTQPKNQKIELPADQYALIDDVENTLAVLKSVLPDSVTAYGKGRVANWANSLMNRTDESLNHRYKEYLRKLVGLTQVGVAMERAQVAVARAALESLKREIVLMEGNEVKALYMWRLGGWCALTFVISLALYLIFAGYGDCIRKFVLVAPFINLKNLLLVISGSSLGLFISFASRRFIESFDDLASVAQDRSDPRLRLIFVLATTIVSSLIFLTGMLTIEIGGFSSNALSHSGTTAFLVGAFFGIAEKALPTTIRRRADDFVGAMAPKS